MKAPRDEIVGWLLDPWFVLISKKEMVVNVCGFAAFYIKDINIQRGKYLITCRRYPIVLLLIRPVIQIFSFRN